jgi:hypothetical protein
MKRRFLLSRFPTGSSAHDVPAIGSFGATAASPTPLVNTMTVMPLTCPSFSESAAPKRPTAPFQPLDPGILDASIPAFFIGRDGDGFWVARDVKGRVGGIFLLESSALAFARRNSWPSGCATISSSERFELDVENQGNPLVIHLRPIIRSLQRVAALTGALAAATRRRLRNFHIP